MKPRLLPIALWLALAPLAMPLNVIAQTSGSDLGDDVSAYRQFIIYPYLRTGFVAMDAGRYEQAITAFSRARELAPKNLKTALYLAEAYRRSGDKVQARAVLVEQGRFTPGAMELQQALAGIPLPIEAPARNPLPEPAPDCSVTHTARCLAVLARDSLRDGQLDQVDAFLHDSLLANSADALPIRRALAQRAIGLGQSSYAFSQFAKLQTDSLITDAERRQWFALLLERGAIAAAEKMQASGGPDDASAQLALAQAMQSGGDTARMGHYMAARNPAFRSEREEQRWLELLLQASASTPAALAAFTPKYPANREARARRLLPDLLSKGDLASARGLLDGLPGGSLPDSRFELALRSGDLGAASHWAQVLVARQGRTRPLDTLTFRLVEAGADAQAWRLLLDAYPFDSDDKRDALLQRMAILAQELPQDVTDDDRQRLRQPLATAGLREGQADVLSALGDCEGIRVVLADMVSEYDARSWSRLAQCFAAAQQPGMAQYAYAQAYARQPDTATARTLAFQASETRDYPVALKAWQSIPAADLLREDMLAAARTAIEADRLDLAQGWLAQYAAKATPQDDAYWWLLAQVQQTHDTGAARASVARAAAIRPDAKYYAWLANDRSDAGDPAGAVDMLEKAVGMAPGDQALQRALGYAYLADEKPLQAKAWLEKSRDGNDDDPTLIRQLAYVSQQSGDFEQARAYARNAIDDLEAGADPGVDDQAQRDSLRRLHENLGRRWIFSADMVLGSASKASIGSPDPARSYRSYLQLEAAYRVLGASRRDPDALAIYARLFSGSSEGGGIFPADTPTLGVGVRWKPIASQVLYLAVEQQVPLQDNSQRRSDVMLRASASFPSGGRFSDDWHESGKQWVSQRVYLDAAYYVHNKQSIYTVDYALGVHMKIRSDQTVEPYMHVQHTTIDQRGFGGSDNELRAGIGVRWNRWSGASRYDISSHRFIVGLEWSHALKTYVADKNSIQMTAGLRW